MMESKSKTPAIVCMLFVLTACFLSGCAAKPVEAPPVVPEETIPSVYTLYFDSMGGSAVEQAKSHPSTGLVTRPPDPFLKGYVFMKWFDSPQEGKPFDFNTPLTEDATVYARWQLQENRICFEGNGAQQGEMQPVSGVLGEAIQLPPNTFEKAGYTFIGWSSVPDGTVKNVDGGWYFIGAEARQVLYACWQACLYRVTLDSCGGEAGATRAEVEFQQPLPHTQAPRRAGYVFAGYFSQKEGKGIQYYNATMAGVRRYDLASDTTLYAHWETALNTILFDGNGSTGGDTGSVSALTESTISIPNCGYLREGYSFMFWNTASDGTGERYYPGDTYVVPASFATLGMYSIWKPNAYTIQFRSNTQEESIRVVNCLYGHPELTAEAISGRVGYSFVGWNTQADGSGDHYAAKQSVKNLCTEEGGLFVFYAEWEANAYTIAFDKQGGTGGHNRTTVYYDRLLPPAISPLKKGYAFEGYFTQPDGTGERYYDEKMQGTRTYDRDGPLTLYACWRAKDNTILFVSEQAASGDTENIVTVTGETVTMPVCGYARTGYVFAGWNAKGDGTGEMLGAGAVYTVDPSDEPIVFYAIWEARLTRLLFEGNGVTTGDTPSLQGRTGDTIVLPTNGYARKGYLFSGWALDAQGREVYPEGSSFHVYASDADIRFYAQWQPTEYTIIYVMNGGSNAKANPSSYTIESMTINLVDPTRLGYTFSGWTGGSVITNGSTGNKTFTANWEIVVYSVTYILNGGVNHASNPTQYTVESPPIVLKNPTKYGYKFEGWAEGSTIESGSVGNRTFTAEWNGERYSISYELDGGINGDGNPGSYTTDVLPIVLSDPYKPGYIFKGWSPTDTIPAGSQDDKVFTALWEIIEYTLTYVLNGGTNHAGNPVKYTVESDDIRMLNPTRSGYDFDGWEEGNLVEHGSIGDRTFTAYWTKIEYDITYVLNEGINHADNPIVYDIETETIVLKAPIRDFYDFLGWKRNGIEDITEIAKGSFGAVTLVAEWQPTQYTITYVLGDGAVNGEGNPDWFTVESEAITLKDPTREGFTFEGWMEDEGYIPVGSVGDRVYTAKWKELEPVDPPVDPDAPVDPDVPVDPPVAPDSKG